jgi:hypothetical protein
MSKETQIAIFAIIRALALLGVLIIVDSICILTALLAALTPTNGTLLGCQSYSKPFNASG